MEPTFEQKPSVEFDAKPHHILEAGDVVFALSEIGETDETGLSDLEYIEWVEAIVSGAEGFGMKDLASDARTLEKMVQNGAEDEHLKHKDELLRIAKEMREAYEAHAQETVTELNAFLAKNPGLFLWSAKPEDTVDEIIVEAYPDGSLQPKVKSNELYIDIQRLNEKYRQFLNDPDTAAF